MGAGWEDALANWEGGCWSLGEKWESWVGGGRGWPQEVPKGGDQPLGGGKGLKCVGRGDVGSLYCLEEKLLGDLI